MNSSVPRLHQAPRELGESGLVLGEPTRLCLATRNVWASSFFLPPAASHASAGHESVPSRSSARLLRAADAGMLRSS